MEAGGHGKAKSESQRDSGQGGEASDTGLPPQLIQQYQQAESRAYNNNMMQAHWHKPWQQWVVRAWEEQEGHRRWM
jgi:hypothetical protein